jgi:hypothetical protein
VLVGQLRVASVSAGALATLVEVERLSKGMHTSHTATSDAGPINPTTVADAVRALFDAVEADGVEDLTPPSGEITSAQADVKLPDDPPSPPKPQDNPT